MIKVRDRGLPPSQAVGMAAGTRPRHLIGVRMIVKKRPMLQITRMGDPGAIAAEREVKILEGIKRRREELRRWLGERGMIPKNKETK